MTVVLNKNLDKNPKKNTNLFKKLHFTKMLIYYKLANHNDLKTSLTWKITSNQTKL